MEGFIVGLKVLLFGILVGNNVGPEDLLIEGFAVGVIDRREVGLLVGAFVTSGVGETVILVGMRETTAAGDAVIIVGVRVAIATGIAIAIVGLLDANNVGAAVDIDGD